jgi:type I restriction enzyme S subunit
VRIRPTIGRPARLASTARAASDQTLEPRNPHPQATSPVHRDLRAECVDPSGEPQPRRRTRRQEKRQTVISHAVTKGLNPDAPMRDSGVEWLGKVPAHWTVSRLKHLTHGATSGPYGSSLTKAMYSQQGFRVYGQQQAIAGDFTVGDYYISERKFTELTRYEVFPGDVLVTVMGTIGRVAVVPKNVERGVINPRLVRYKAQHHKITPDFLRLSLLGEHSQSRLALMSQGSTMEGLNMQILGELPIPVPGLEEQSAILCEVDRKLTRLDSLIGSAGRARDLLAERRTALISAAVTGKIDVRAWTPPEPTETA